MPIIISRFLGSLVSSLKYMRKKENLGTHHLVIPWVFRSLTFLTSLYLSESLLMFVLDVMSMVFSRAKGGIGNGMFATSSCQNSF